jgi:uncharacterized protein (TIGR02145 family)
MTKRFLISMVILLVTSKLVAQQYGSLKDSRDGKVYKTVNIGDQVWLAENLNTDCFRNGDLILQAESDEEWQQANDRRQPAWCYFNNDFKNGIKYGKLYNWYAIIDKRGLAPNGWHIPSDSDWRILSNYLGGNNICGLKLKSQNGWQDGKNGSNITGFSALPGSFRNIDGSFNHIGKFGYWWSSTDYDSDNAWNRILDFFSNGISTFTLKKDCGMSVRIIKD